MILAYYLWRVMGVFASLVPPPLADGFARGCGYMVYYTWFARRRVARDNFARVLNKPWNDPAVGHVARASFGNYCIYIMEMLRYPRLSDQDFNERVTIHEDENINAAMAADKPVIVVSAHFGNMDYAAPVASRRYRRFTLAAETIKPVQLFEYLAEQRAARGADLIPYDRAPRKIIEALRRKEIVGFLIDFGINAQKDIHTAQVTFFGGETRFPSSPALLAQRFDAPLLVASTYIDGDGEIHVTATAPIYVPRDLPRAQAEQVTMQLVAERFEDFIRAHPEQWYVFRPMWPPSPPRPRRAVLKRLTSW